MSDYITCSKCGIVERGHRCPYKTYKKKTYGTEADRFRKSKRWTNKSLEIRQRDKYLCKVCMANLYNTVQQFNYKELDVHHIEKLSENFNKRLDNDNLITLCRYHHKMADDGEIPKEVLYELLNNPPCLKVEKFLIEDRPNLALLYTNIFNFHRFFGKEQG